MNNYTEFLEKVQGEWLNSLKQVQDLNLKTLNAFTKLASELPNIDVKEFSAESLPSPVELVERSFAFTDQLLETRKEYMVKLAEFATEAQKQFTDSAKRVAETAKN